ncbi:MAG: hypothetical protein JTT17_01265 [Candidatus Brockarchaeota archaeon]|nr:hypothetical protein [Candidatus Brockarchaeota archaeon]
MGGQLSVSIPVFLVGRIVESLNSMAGFKRIPATSMYEALRGMVRDKTVIVYYSGSIVYDRSLRDVRNVIEEVLYEYYKEKGTVIGSDEAGKGEAFGPLTVAAVALNPRQAAHLQSVGVMDSKLIPENRIFRLASEVRKASLAYSVLRITPFKFNKMLEEGKHGNLNDILAMGHAKVLKKVVSKIPERSFKVIIDKFDSSKGDKRLRMIEEYLNGIKVHAIVGGEACSAVAAASILARAAYLKWVFSNISEAAFNKIKEGDYSMIKEDEKHLYFKMRYMKDFREYG